MPNPGLPVKKNTKEDEVDFVWENYLFNFFWFGGLQVDLHMKEEVCVCSALLKEYKKN